MSRAESAISAATPIGKNLVRVADPPTYQTPYATTDNSTHLVHLAGRHLPSTCYHTPTTERTRLLGTNGHCGEMQDAPPQPHMDAPCTRRISNGCVDAQVESDRHPGKPATREQDPKQVSLHPTVCNRYGVRNPNWQH